MTALMEFSHADAETNVYPYKHRSILFLVYYICIFVFVCILCLYYALMQTPSDPAADLFYLKS